MPTDDREKQFERALARHLRNASPDSACPDAETLAAYHERTLSLEEMARWKEHIAGCARCQEALALVEQSEDVRRREWEHRNVPVPVENLGQPRAIRGAGASVHEDEERLLAEPIVEAATPIRKAAAHPPWRWIVPAGALAASVILWIGMREIQKQHSREMESLQVAQNRQAVAETPPALDQAKDQWKREEPPAQKLDEELRSQKAGTAPSPRPTVPQPATPAASANSRLSAPAMESPPAKQKDLGASGATGKIATTQPVQPPSAYVRRSRDNESPAPPAASAPAPAAVASGVGSGAGGAIANRPAEEKKKAPVPNAAETVEVTAGAPQADTTTTSSSTSVENLPAGGRNFSNLVQLAGGDRRYVLAPGETHAWRVGETGGIERSTDRGKTWKLQNSGVTLDLTAGSATSDKVCWIVGKSGTVLLTTDGGKHWKQIPSPINEDLGGIHATDALHASIWDVPNRKSYETSDGGMTWRRTSNE